MTSKASKTKSASEPRPTEVHTPISQPLPRRVERAEDVGRPRGARALEPKF